MRIGLSFRLACIALLLGGQPGCSALALDGCSPHREASLPIHAHPAGLIGVTAAVRSQPILMLVDTGAAYTVIDRTTVERLGLPLMDARNAGGRGIGGDIALWRVDVPDFTLGTYRIDPFRIHAFSGQGGQVRFGLLGADFLGDFDFAMDVPAGTLDLYAPSSCVQEPPWGGQATRVPLLAAGKLAAVEVRIDGKPLVGLLDSGAARTVLSWRGARKLGLTPNSPGLQPDGYAIGADGMRIQGSAYRFKRFEIGDERILEPRITIIDFYRGRGGNGGEPDLLLGADWIRAHRLYVARSVGALYFTSLGIPVFPWSGLR